MIRTDNTTVVLPDLYRRHRELKPLLLWLKERNIKYSLIYWPEWMAEPSGINMRNEDALLFRLTFNI